MAQRQALAPFPPSAHQPKLQRQTLDEFKALQVPSDVEALVGKINGGSLMDCHLALYKATGIWMPELVPIFQKMDALIVARDLAPELMP